MAGLFDKLADVYLDARPTYPSDWYSMLSARTSAHRLAWDAGTGNGQAALCVAEHYDRVIATDVSESQLKLGMAHPKISYHHTPQSMTEDEIVALIGGENSVDLVTVATAVHHFDIPKFYAVAKRVLRKPGGIIAVWSYGFAVVSPEFDAVLERFISKTLPYWKYPNVEYIFKRYKNLPFPFESVGMGCEGNPIELEFSQTLSFEGFLGVINSWSGVATAKDKGVELLSESVVKELENGWGGSGHSWVITQTSTFDPWHELYKARMPRCGWVSEVKDNMEVEKRRR